MSIRSVVTRVLAGAVVGPLLLLSSPATVVHAQPSPRKLFDDASLGGGSSKRHVPALRARKTTGHPGVLTDNDVIVNLFDDLQLTVHKTKVEKYLKDHYVWHGKTDEGDIVTIALVRGVMTVTVHGSGHSFEVAPDGNGTYVVSELDSAAFPTEDPAGDNIEPIVTPAGDAAAAGDATSGSSSLVAGADASGATTIDALVVWTPAARNAVGGSVDAIQSLVLSAVANANQAFVNSGVHAQYRLVYSGEVNYAESAIETDLSALTANTSVKSLRAQYGADVVTMLGSGYAGAGSCGYGYIMSSVSTSFAPYAFSVVDQSCAAGYLSYAHEAGHNEGLQHDPANAGSAPSYPYAYGYQDPAGQFRTVMSYGGETRIPYFSSPLVTFNGAPTGVASQDNARALNNNLATVANFVAATDGSVGPGSVPQPCTYAVSASAVDFGTTASSSNVAVTTTSECGWTTSSSAGWISVTGGTSGSGTVKVTVTANTGGARTGTVTIAGQPVTITQSAPLLPCSFTVSPGALSVASGATSANVSVTTTTGCTWSTSSSASWITVTSGSSGSGTVKVSVASNTGALRTATITIAAQPVTVTQNAGKPPRGKGH